MEHPESARLERTVEVLEKLKENANGGIGGIHNKFFAAAAAMGGLSAFLLYAGISHYGISPQEVSDFHRVTDLLSVAAGGSSGVFALIYGAKSVLDYYRSKILGDEIARIQAQGYNAQGQQPTEQSS